MGSHHFTENTSLLILPLHEHPTPSPSPPCSVMSPISPVLSSTNQSDILAPMITHAASAEQQLQSSVDLHQQHQQQIRAQLARPEHPLHLPSQDAIQKHQHQLATQLEYYKQLQIMHCQRLRDIELLQLQHRQGRTALHQHQTLHSVKRFHLAQRMLEAQTLHHARQIQRIQYLQKISTLQKQPLPSPTTTNGTAEQLASEMNETDLARLEIDPNTIHIPTRTAAPPRLDLQQILGHPATPGTPPPQHAQGRSSVPELAKIVLPSLVHIRKQRQQRLKYQARLRQSAAGTAAMRAANQTTAAEPNISRFQSGEASGVQTGVCAIKEPSLARQESAVVWTSSTTSIVPRPQADLQYKRQLRHSMALQQHMIQEHTHRYRIFQAFCLLQRAREAQALDELQSHKRRQLQTLAWVEALRRSKELEIPQ
ncbi:hypothetical protein BGZ70_007796 [Mortierella alpina]|uniref:Uncharacterized protein n=1 Tax=Mortierella alpina TaxID=64518 RepID=A0A9P6M2K5_MORAP|nr:hypothetical protein BGZ70_007796 [Mortierella alpina]